MRSYHQYCAVARALDVLGDRWSLLIVRNLLLGPQRWSELVDDLPGIAKNLLSARLTSLAEAGILIREDDAYALTPRGAELETPLFALGDWGERQLLGPPRAPEAIRPRYLMTSIRRRLRPSKTRARLEIEIEGAVFSVQLGPTPQVMQGSRNAKTSIVTDLAGLHALIGERRPLSELVGAGRLALRGDARVVEAFVRALPPSPALAPGPPGRGRDGRASGQAPPAGSSRK